MARTKGAKDKAPRKTRAADSEAAEPARKTKARPSDGAPAAGHNSAMADADLERLHRQHLSFYETALAAKKAADANFKNACKAARADLGKGAIDDIKTAILLRTPEGEAEFKAKIEAQVRVARWYGMPVGTQGDFFAAPAAPTPGNTDMASALGKVAGKNGQECKPPYPEGSPAGQAWIQAWHEGNALMLEKGIKKLEPDPQAGAPQDDVDDERDLRPGFLQSGDVDDPLEDTPEAVH